MSGSPARWLSIAVLAFCLGVALLTRWDFGLFSFLRGIPSGDKLAHVVMGALLTLGLVGFVGLPRTWRSWRLPACLAVSMLALAIEEGTQALTPGRSFTMLDLWASYLGVAIAALLAVGTLAWKSRTR